MNKHIKVTKAHIEAGLQMECKFCPVALATMLSLKRQDIEVRSSIKVGGIEYKMTRSVDRFISRFDAGKSVKPFGFWLRG